MEKPPSNNYMAKQNAFIKKLRLDNKKVENLEKPPLISADVLNTKEFVFSKFSNDGDSGQLLLAKNKLNRNEKYLVKHQFTDCAINEFVYYKLYNYMNISTPRIKLFSIAPDEKRKYFKTEYIMGAEFIDVLDIEPSYENIREHAVNWTDYFKYKAMYFLTDECDGIEILLSQNKYIYRVDTTAAFPLGPYDLDYAGINLEIDGINTKEEKKKELLKRSFAHQWSESMFKNILTNIIENFGEECASYFFEPLHKIQDIPEHYIDDFLNTLCYFYPDFIGEYYKKYIDEMKKAAKKLLRYE